MAKEYDALLPRTQPDSEEEIHEKHSEDERDQLEEKNIESPIEEALQEPLVEGITKELLDIAIKNMELPQIYVTKDIPKQLHVEDLDLPQVHHIEGNTICFAYQLEQFDS